MLMAGLGEPWKSPDGWIRSCTIITTEANELVAKLHNRMPAIVAPDDYAPWLGEEPASPDQLKAMLRPYPPERLASGLSTGASATSRTRARSWVESLTKPGMLE